MKATIFDAIGNDTVLIHRSVSDVDQARHWCNNLWCTPGRTHKP